MDNLTLGIIFGGMFACGMLLYKILFDNTEFYERKIDDLKVENAKLSIKLQKIQQTLDLEK